MNHQHIGKLLPIDGFAIKINAPLSMDCLHSLTHLYQPLVGSDAISLYQTLLSECQLRNNKQELQTHHTLMNYLSLPLDKLYQARLKLEGIGLLSTYKTEQEQKNIYTYQLAPPFPPVDFFNDGMLSQLLYHHLGEKKYMELLRLFDVEEREQVPGENVTMGFADVFDTHINHFTAPVSPVEEKQPDNKKYPEYAEKEVDFAWIEQLLQKRMISSRSVLTTANKKLIQQMTVLYDLPVQDLESAVMWAINEDNQLDAKEFKSACHDLFQAKARPADIKLVEKQAGNPKAEKAAEAPESKEEQFVRMLEEISPKELLEDLSGGNQASAQDLKTIRDVMTQQGLTPGVMNVLVHYVLLKTDMKLSKAYLEKIASHWARKKVTTVKQAMALAKSENQKYQQWGSAKQNNYRKPAKKEVIPDWFKERKGHQNDKGLQEKPMSAETEENQEDLGELIRSYLENGS
ncbi:replication initiation and membrane attachment family protein [Virgibacillus senegalensis]|uniref:replication initiation and membrane attachment family protein n=1 Tax=Virgibacillus senegalensis TaxID=1499679 RepID=UPI00069D405A|nr:DnaD domain protein [Virgibacillus senegalensis]